MPKKRGKALFVVICVFAGIVACLCTYLSIMGTNLFPSGFVYSLNVVTTRDYEPDIPKGSALLVDRRYYPEVGEIAAYYNGVSDQVRFGTVVLANANQVMLRAGSDSELNQVGYQFVDGYVFTTIPHLGTVWDFLHTYHIYVWCVFGMLTAALVAVGTTSGTRYRRKRRQQFQEIFEFYGAKYDLEDAGVDY